MSKEYEAKRDFFDKILTIYGRNATIEALKDKHMDVYRLHLSTSNKPAVQIDMIEKLAKAKGADIRMHTKQELSRISKNSKQDQGVALDIQMSNFMTLDEFVLGHDEYNVIAIDGITNPQNLGMLIRSAVAGNIDAILLSTASTASISPLVIKASAGTLFKIPIIKCTNIAQSIDELQSKEGAVAYLLDARSKNNYAEIKYCTKTIFVLGNESDGASESVKNICKESIFIPMNRGVESLNVAVVGSILSFI